jgi:hypothetical protein
VNGLASLLAEYMCVKITQDLLSQSERDAVDTAGSDESFVELFRVVCGYDQDVSFVRCDAVDDV